MNFEFDVHIDFRLSQTETKIRNPIQKGNEKNREKKFAVIIFLQTLFGIRGIYNILSGNKKTKMKTWITEMCGLQCLLIFYKRNHVFFILLSMVGLGT